MVTLRVTASDRRPSLPGGDRPAIQWSTRARRGARRAGGAAPSDFRRGPAPAAPREPRTPPLPGSPSGDKENAGGMSWAGQLWKQYDPINRIIFPGVGAKATYNERGTSRRRCATSSFRSPRVSASPLPALRDETDSTRTRVFTVFDTPETSARKSAKTARPKNVERAPIDACGAGGTRKTRQMPFFSSRRSLFVTVARLRKKRAFFFRECRYNDRSLSSRDRLKTRLVKTRL